MQLDVATNDLKLSDCGWRRSLCGEAAGGEVAGAQAVTPGAVRCSAMVDFCRSRISDPSHFGHAIGWKSALLRMLAHEVFTWRDVNTIDLVVGDVALDLCWACRDPALSLPTTLAFELNGF